MARAKSKNMTVDFLVKDAEQYDKLKKVTFENGMYTEIYEKFSNDRIDSCMDDCGKFISEYSKTRKINEEKIMNYTNLHILKWFSTALDYKTNSFEETVLLFDELKKSNYLELIFNSFDKQEVAKVFDRMFKKLQTLQEVYKANSDVRDQIKQQIMKSNVENKEELMKIFFNEDVSVDGDTQES